MTSKILLRAAAVLMFLHCVGHTFGTLGWKTTSDPVKQEVIRQMTDHRFPFMGAVHSMADAFDGYGFVTILALFLMAAILWIFSDAIPENKSQSNKVLTLLSFVLLLWGVVELIFFFPFAASFTLLSMLLTVVARLRTK